MPKNVMQPLFTCLSPALLKHYDVSNSIVVIIDVLRATSTIATALANGAKCVVPVDSVAECIRIGKQIEAVTAGERDGKIAEGLQYGNSPFDYPKSFIKNKTLVLTTTNGTRLLHMALDKGAKEIITGAFANLQSVSSYLMKKNMPVVLACAAWKDKINIEDSLFAGAVIEALKGHFEVKCDSSKIAHNLYSLAKDNFFEFMKLNNASHYERLTKFGIEKDIIHCLTENTADVLPIYKEGKLILI